MKLVILGGSGFVGGHLARRLSRDGHAIVVATRHAPRARRLRIIPGVTIRPFDPFDLDRLTRELQGQDALINLVGVDNPHARGNGSFQRVHAELPEIAIEACRRAKVGRLLHMSALNAGSEASASLEARGLGERRIESSGLNWSMFRPSMIFGPDDRFLRRFDQLLKLFPIVPLARPDAVMAPAFVGDVAEALARSLAARETGQRTFELCGPEAWHLRDIVEWIAAQRGLRRWIVGLPDPLGRLQSGLMEFVPGTPFSRDGFRTLGLDSVCAENGFARLGIQPWALDEKAGEWIGSRDRQSRFRRFRELAGRGGPNE